MNFVVGIPVFNEEKHVEAVVREVHKYASIIAVVDDGSTDRSKDILQALLERGEIQLLIAHRKNLGYGQTLIDLMRCVREAGYDCLVTLDCDEQHQPSQILEFASRFGCCDIISGTRYPSGREDGGDPAPPDRRRINRIITGEINRLTGYGLTDAFCGFKAYGKRALAELKLREPGYGMPLELWIKAAASSLTVCEIPVHRIYKDQTRSFGAGLDDADRRLAYYRAVIDKALQEVGWNVERSRTHGSQGDTTHNNDAHQS